MNPDKETFHVVIRIPTKRPKGFAEPPPIIWTDEMEHKLWQYMSQKKNDWKTIAEELGVPSSYLVRHAAHMYETQLRGIHQQLRLSGNNTSMSRNVAKSPTPSLKRPPSIRYSNTLQQQPQQTPPQPQLSPPQIQENTESQPITNNDLSLHSSNPLKLSPIEAADPFPPAKPLQSPTESLYKSTLGRVHTENTAYIKEDSDDSDGPRPASIRESDDEDDDEKQGEEEDEDERFSSHFERMKMEVEEPAFLRKRSEGSTSSLSASRHQLSLSIQNLRKPSNEGSSAIGSPKRIFSPTTHSPATRPSTAPGSNNNSAMNSSTSSFSDISETSVTQSAMEDAFLSNFGNGGGSKLSSFMSFSRK